MIYRTVHLHFREKIGFSTNGLGKIDTHSEKTTPISYKKNPGDSETDSATQMKILKRLKSV